MKFYSIIILLLLGTLFNAQVVNKTESNKINPNDTLVIDSGRKDSIIIFRPTIKDYQYKTHFSENKVFDTVFTIDKYYKFSQFNNKDNFGKVQFANIGAGFNDLVYQPNSEKNLSLLPSNKSHFILGIQDIKYYDVKTPTTSFIYHTAAKNGAALQSTYTQNIGKNINIALEYMGLRSLGFYQRNLSASNNTLFSGHFVSKNSKYEAFAHYLHQNVNNEENGGIESVDTFLNGSSTFRNRRNLSVNLKTSDSRFSYRRYYFSQAFRPFSSEKFPFKIRHTIFHQGNKFYFNQQSLESYYDSDYIENYGNSSKKYSENLSNTVSVIFDTNKLKLDAGVRHQLIKLGVGQALPDFNIPGEWSENRLGAVGNLGITLWEKFNLKSSLEFSNGATFGNFLKSENNMQVEPIKDYIVNAKFNFQSAAPSFNYLLNSSFYQDFNYNFSGFKNETVTEIGGDLQLKWFDSKVFIDYFRIDNFAYIDQDFTPKQSSSSLNISQIGGEATLKYWKLNFNTKLLFQGNLSQKELLPLPNFIGRLNVYYQNKAFKDAAEIQTGIKAYYFTKFASREYFPVLNEFILPQANSQIIGGKPIIDAYFNLKVKTMMVFAEAQHFTTTFMRNKSFAAPSYPVSDFRFNLGIVWYLFH